MILDTGYKRNRIEISFVKYYNKYYILNESTIFHLQICRKLFVSSINYFNVLYALLGIFPANDFSDHREWHSPRKSEDFTIITDLSFSKVIEIQDTNGPMYMPLLSKELSI